MTIFRNSYANAELKSLGFSFHNSKRDAQLSARIFKEGKPNGFVETASFIFDCNQGGMIRALTRFGSHPDNA